MNEKQLWVVRHGQSRAQTGEDDTIDPGLSDLGVEQADALPAYLKDFTFDHIRVSPLRRALDTYKRSKARGNEVAIDTRILETTLGRWGDYDYSPLAPFRGHGLEVEAPEAWSLPPIGRVASLVAALKELPGKTILLVGHCGIFQVLRSYLLSGENGDVDYRDFEEDDILRNTAIGTFVFDAGGTHHTLLRWNFTPHLDLRESDLFLTR